MKFKDRIKGLLEENNFFGLEYLLQEVGLKEFEDALSDATFDYKTLLSYTFLCMLLIKKETAELHFMASALLAFPLCHIEGAYVSGYYHASKAAALDPKDVSYKEFLLFFHEVPDQLLSSDKALELARKILEKDSNSKVALGIVERYGSKK